MIEKESFYVTLNRVVIPEDFVKSMSKTQKRQYLMVTNMLRDLNLLQKLLLYVNHNENTDEPTKCANTTISLFFLKTLISKNHEMWEFFQNEKLREEGFSDQLNEWKRQIIDIFSEEKNEKLLSYIRNKFGFHYESNPKFFAGIEELIDQAMNTHEKDMWLSNTDSGNEIFGSSNAIMLKIIFAKMKELGFSGDEQSLMNQLFDLTLTKLSRLFHDFYKLYLIEIVLKGVKLIEDPEVSIEAPLLSKVNLPLIVKSNKAT